MSKTALGGVITELATYIAREESIVAELREMHSDDWQVLAEANAKAQHVAELKYFYERLKYVE